MCYPGMAEFEARRLYNSRCQKCDCLVRWEGQTHEERKTIFIHKYPSAPEAGDCVLTCEECMSLWDVAKEPVND